MRYRYFNVAFGGNAIQKVWLHGDVRTLVAFFFFILVSIFTLQSIKPLPWKARVPEKPLYLRPYSTANQATMQKMKTVTSKQQSHSSTWTALDQPDKQ